MSSGKVGTKRADKRWRDPNGDIWASQFEYRVFEGLRDEFGGDRVFRCATGEDHSFGYTTPVKQGLCMDCSGGEVVQRRIYTPDLYFVQDTGDKRKTYIETKGYFSAEKRNLLASFRKTGEDIDLIVVLQANGKATKKRTLKEWVTSYIKVPVFAWDPSKKPMPDDLMAFLLTL